MRAIIFDIHTTSSLVCKSQKSLEVDNSKHVENGDTSD